MENKTTIKIATITILALSAILFLAIRGRNKNLKDILVDLNVNMELTQDYKATNKSKIVDDSKTITTVLATSKDNLIKIQAIEGMSEEEATAHVNNQKYLINSIFKKQNVPYPGPLTNLAECPSKYLPVVEEKDESDGLRIFYYMYANDRLVFGGYDEASLKYAMVLGFIYCRAKNELFRIEYFTPKENGPLIHKNILESFRCQR
jgi:hypothetical protein